MRAWIPNRALSQHAVLTLLPWVALVAILWRYHVDVFYWDQWELVPAVDKAFQGTLSFADLWAQHNEHRPFFPRLVMVSLAWATGWNTLAEVALNVAMMSVLVPALWWTTRQWRHDGDAPLPAATWPTVSLLLFSPAQWQNWMWGWQLVFFLALVANILGLTLLCRSRAGWGSWTAAALLGIVGSYSFGACLLYWPVALVVLVVRRDPARWWRVVAWGAVAVLVSAVYAHGWQPNPYHPKPASNFVDARSLVRLGYYVATILGSPLAPHNWKPAFVAGNVGTTLFAWLTWRAWRRGRLDAEGLLPFALGLYALGIAGLIGLGRAGLGIEQALESRYITISLWLWVSVVLSLASLTAEPSHDGPSWLLRHVYTVTAATVVAGLLVNGWPHGLQQCRAWQQQLSPAREALIRGTDKQLIQRLYPVAEIVMERRAVLQRWHLSVFRGHSDEAQP